ncbi:MAG: hypothetical protein PVH79_02800 [Candidatus Bathyarchaeota archaeon]|jgi:hypothetical protein
MLLIVWLVLAMFVALGLLHLFVMSIGAFVSIVVGLALLPLRLFIWVLRMLFRIF